jgi:hypothetical protein
MQRECFSSSCARVGSDLEVTLTGQDEIEGDTVSENEPEAGRPVERAKRPDAVQVA